MEDLKEADVGHFTHGHKDEREFKAVLHGLSDYTDAEVMEGLKQSAQLEVEPIYVRRMTRVDHERGTVVQLPFFAVSFPAGTKMGQLANLKDVNRVRCSFRAFYPSKRKPRCTWCQAWGHTRRLCRMPVCCGYCAMPHQTVNCVTFTRDTPKEELTCGSCKEKGHPAGDIVNCQAAIDYFAGIANNQQRQAIRNGRNTRGGAQQRGPGAAAAAAPAAGGGQTRWAKRNVQHGEIEFGEAVQQGQGAWSAQPQQWQQQQQQQQPSYLEEILVMMRRLEQQIDRNCKTVSNMATVFGRRLNLQTSDIERLINTAN